MNAATLSKAMGCSLAKAKQMVDGYNIAMKAANITNVNRAAMFAAQIGHESAGLVYMEEIASGAAYEGRKDLGNTQPGDGRRFKGSGPIQLTGRHNFTKFSAWAASKGYISDPKLFVNRPELVRQNSTYGFLAASWYWVVARPHLNAQCDRQDLNAVTRSINGGLNGLADRRARWNRCRKLGKALLPSGAAVAAGKTYSTAMVKRLQGQVGVTPDGYWGQDTEDNAQAIRAFLKGGLVATTAERNVYLKVRAARPTGKRTTAEFRKGIQWALGVKQDGIWGPATEAAFQGMRDQHKMKNVRDKTAKPPVKKKATPPKTKTPTFPLKRGYYFGPRSGPKQSVSGYYSHRADLKRWQQQMKSRGWKITVDGLYGSGTARVARQFQKEKGLTADSKIGVATWNAAWEAKVT